MEKLDKAKKKYVSMNKSEDDKDQAFKSTAKEEKCTELRKDTSLSRSPISISVRLRQKLKFQESG